MKVVSAVLVVALAVAVSPQCVNIKQSGAHAAGYCAESCAKALDQCQESLGTGDSAGLVKCLTTNLDPDCALAATVGVKGTLPWYKAKWFIALMSALGVLAVLGAIYHLMGHPGLGGHEHDETVDLHTDNLEEDRERLM